MSKETKCLNKDEPGFRWPVHHCKNMKGVEGDLSMEAEHYECKVCGETCKLYYSEMS